MTKMVDFSKIQLIVLDIDGTITNGERLLSMEAVMAIRDAEKAGIRCMLASGNLLPVTATMGIYVGISGPVIAEDGGVIYLDDDLHVLGSREKAYNAYLKLKDILDLKPLYNDSWRLSEVVLEPDSDLEQLREYAAELGMQVQDALFSYHFLEQGVNKFSGLCHALERYFPDLTAENILAIGDAGNDVEMIQECGIGGTPSSASDELKDKADIVSPLPYGEGTAWIIGLMLREKGLSR